MKRILLAGYGNIAHAFEKIMNEQESRGSYMLATCDLKEGQDILHFLPRHHDEFDVVVNTSLANSNKVARMCIDYGLDYIDVGIEDGLNTDDAVSSLNYLEVMKQILRWPTRSHVMFGFGVNPGILEHVYQRYKPQGAHYAFELEHDDAESDDYEIFGTWSPFMYSEESCRADLMVVNKQGIIDVTQRLKDNGRTMYLTYHGGERHYLPIPHEELLSMMLSDENLQGTAYLFQAVRGMQQYFLERGADITDKELLAIPVPHCLKGEDQVGILFWDTKERLYWVKNVMANQTTWKRYGINAVCWQTATGAWIAYRLLDAVSTDHPHTMTELSQLMPDTIDALLKQIGFTLEVEEQPFSIDEFKENIMCYF
jgi:hypothetical protein